MFPSIYLPATQLGALLMGFGTEGFISVLLVPANTVLQANTKKTSKLKNNRSTSPYNYVYPNSSIAYEDSKVAQSLSFIICEESLSWAAGRE